MQTDTKGKVAVIAFLFGAGMLKTLSDLKIMLASSMHRSHAFAPSNIH